MKRIKVLSVLAVSCLFMAFALGSSSSSSTAPSTKVGEVQSSTPKVTASEAEPSEEVKQSSQKYNVGDIIETKSIRISYLKAGEYVSDNQFLQPKEGYKYVYIEIEAENLSSSDQMISYFSFDCYADGYACEGFYGMDDALSATISPGRKAKGTIAFEVPVDASEIEFEFEDNVWTNNKIIFVVQ